MRKISPNLIGFLIAIFIAIGSLYFYLNYVAKKSDHILDNHSSLALKVQIDEKKYSLAPEQAVFLHLKKGSHHLKITNKNDSLIDEFNFEVHKSRGVINLTKRPYFIFSLPYGPKVNADSIFRNNQTLYQGKVYYGALKIDSSHYIEDFYYNLNENFPAVTKRSLNDTLRTKIFREDDFKQFYFEKFE